MQTEPDINVGILSATEIKIELTDGYSVDDVPVSGLQTFVLSSTGRILWNGREYESIMFKNNTSSSTFAVFDVVIGVNFHWERRETQRFSGNARLIVEGEKITLINTLPVEDYLLSVISSEMSATASLEFLKSHAVISRSWLLAQINKDKNSTRKKYRSVTVKEDEIVKWYDREDHVNFDVCADDHCQRYQGVTRQTTDIVRQAVEATRGTVLTDCEGQLCDARFSKCCGGVFEEFENCWEPIHFDYLSARRDYIDEQEFPNLSKEDNARRWILERPDAYCNTDDDSILSQVLNNYDQETKDFYRWQVGYSQKELATLIKERTGFDFGGIISLDALERGTSGRIVRLRIVGTKRTMTIGKELEIRKSLSKSHLYSSAFIVETIGIDKDGLPEQFILHGAGWGHGVGLCQIGAAVMGANGADFRQILTHYFPGADLTVLY